MTYTIISGCERIYILECHPRQLLSLGISFQILSDYFKSIEPGTTMPTTLSLTGRNEREAGY